MEGFSVMQQAVEAGLGGCDVKAQNTGAPCTRLSPVQGRGGWFDFPQTLPCAAELIQSWELWGGEGWGKASTFSSAQSGEAALWICFCVQESWLSFE